MSEVCVTPRDLVLTSERVGAEADQLSRVEGKADLDADLGGVFGPDSAEAVRNHNDALNAARAALRSITGVLRWDQAALIRVAVLLEETDQESADSLRCGDSPQQLRNLVE